ncbi:MAG: hypothetical protein ACLQUY_01590 [Ktedonobacterales bacterium]
MRPTGRVPGEIASRARFHSAFVAVEVEHIVTGHHLDTVGLGRAVELSKSKYCSMSQTIAKTATITISYRVVEAES